MEDMSAVASGHPEAPTQTFSANPVERRQYGTQPTLKVHAPMTAVAALCALALWQLAKYSSRSDGCLSESSNDSNWPGRDSAGIRLLTEFRTFSRVRERLAYSNWMTTSTGGLWPTAAVGPIVL
ncbi:hypothetical protein [Accumulibacter sp.]|uniref:hypothetical protein n=1 Tax=Accumulibacter sp. TaxID=2053492 RepID=UPI001AD34612|nr:hypothetical protein [Accumulibacter sp.]MBN8513340.1 hypothetical protein [Accumulibacter sp.]MBO3704671.1 hypothetical protein [Accumulibacter sp.]